MAWKVRNIFPHTDEVTTHDSYYVFDTNLGPRFPVNYVIAMFITSVILNFVAGWIAILFVVFSVISMAAYSGVEVNLSDMVYRDYSHLFHWRWGKFKTIEAPDYLLISKTSRGKGIRYDIHLITKGKRDLLLFRTYDKEEQLNVVRLLSRRHGWSMYDNTIDGAVPFE
jgi:hypothetical protein